MNKIIIKHLNLIFLSIIVFLSFILLILPNALNYKEYQTSNLIPKYKGNLLSKSSDEHILLSQDHDLFIYLSGKIIGIDNKKVTVSFVIPIIHYKEIKNLEEIRIFLGSKEVIAGISKIGDEVFDNNIFLEAFFIDDESFFKLNMPVNGKFFLKTLYNVFIVPKKFIYNENGYSYAYKKERKIHDTVFIRILYDLENEDKYIVTGDFFEYEVLVEKR